MKLRVKVSITGLLLGIALLIVPHYHMDLYPYNMIPAMVGGLLTGIFIRRIYEQIVK